MSDDRNEDPRAAALPRVATDDPDRFVIPASQLPEGFAERVGDRSRGSAEARPAATVVLMRPGQEGPEALLLRRPAQSSFAADAWVFPGGRVDPADADLTIADLCDGPAPDEWRKRLGVETEEEAIGYVSAAIREAWEETGVILADECPRPAGELEKVRRQILADEVSLRDAAAREGLRLRTADLLYIAHWITPAVEPRRYDTRFFLARVAAETVCGLYGDELVEAEWIRPAEAIARNRDAQLKLLPPTLHTLRRLTGFASLDDLWTALRDAPVPRILPTMRRDADGIVIELKS